MYSFLEYSVGNLPAVITDEILWMDCMNIRVTESN